jgi:peptidyl-prolyl cis-trans isomerase SurA
MLPNNKYMKRHTRYLSTGFAAHTIAALTIWLGLTAAGGTQAPPQAQTADRILVIVNDQPISEYELRQRTKLIRALGAPKISAEKLRELVIKRLVEERLKRQEATRLKIKVTDKQILSTINNMAKRSRQSVDGIKARLKKAGVSFDTLKQQIQVTVAWNTVIRRKFSRRISVDKSDVKRTHAKMLQKPPPSRKIAVLRQVILPIRRGGLVGSAQTRQIEARRIYRRFKGCGSLKRITSSVFNVHVGPARSMPLERLPPPLRKLLLQTGPGRISRPAASRGGIVMIAYCGNKEIKAPPITEKQVENQLINQQLIVMATRLLRDLREDSVIEYR